MTRKKRREIPRFRCPIIETHCHLDYLDADSLADELGAARDSGVHRIVTIAVSPDNLATVRSIAAANRDVFCTQGIHPHEAESYTEAVEAEIRRFATAGIAAGATQAAAIRDDRIAATGSPVGNLAESGGESGGESGAESGLEIGAHDAAADNKIVAIGEIGLDYYYDHADRSVQRKVFARQLAIAADAGLPVVIHTRDADDDTRSILAEYAPSLARRGVIHSFSSGLALAEFALDAGFDLGFNGMVTFRNADNVRAAVELAPVEQILLETDAPYLTPVPYRGQSNGPRYLPFIAEKVAEVKAMEVEALLAQCISNSERLFFPHLAPVDREGAQAA
ncbi:MAG: TatD family hydrolase [Halieaceae bacterium]|jgi:TatD DNase family protein|nr:TatD family hydrolase [Halieaceae bacterium]